MIFGIATTCTISVYRH